MATETPVKEESLRGPSIVPPSMLATSNFFIIGSDDRPNDMRTVAVSVACRVNIKVAEREFSTAVPLHEALVLRTYYDRMAGGCTVTFQGYWPPGIERYRRLTHDLLKAEVSRLSARVVPRKDSTPLDCFGMYFPGTLNERLTRMHKVMGEIYDAWEKLMVIAAKRIPPSDIPERPELKYSMACNYITEQEIEAIIRIADPAATELSEIFLPEVKISAAPVISPLGDAGKDLTAIINAANALADKQTETASEAAFDRLVSAGFDASVAEKAASLLEKHESFAKIPEDAITGAIGGKGKLHAAKVALKG